jgi:hypothetical protein
MRGNEVHFDGEDLVALAKFVAEITREGLAFRVHKWDGEWVVVITGF